MDVITRRIPEKLFFRIGEVCELIKVQPHVLRYWETEFPMLAPQKNRAGQRVYRRKDVEMVMRIRDLLYEEKFTIAGAKKRLLDEIRSSSPRVRPAVRETQVADTDLPDPASQTKAPSQPELLPGATGSAPSSDSTIAPQASRTIQTIKRDLEALLTLLNLDASINR
jgi:DNA-binding transcriptional MerR regulator